MTLLITQIDSVTHQMLSLGHLACTIRPQNTIVNPPNTIISMSKTSSNQFAYTRKIINLENIIITIWSYHELGETANNTVVLNPYNWSYVAAIILHFLWLLYTIIFLSFLPIKAQPISSVINDSIMY